MKQVSTLLLTSALALSTPVIADQMSDMRRHASSAQMELDTETGGCLKTLTVQNNTIDKMKMLLDKRKGRIAELENSMQPLNNELASCKDKLAGAGSEHQTELNSLTSENRKLKTENQTLQAANQKLTTANQQSSEIQQKQIAQLEQKEKQLKRLSEENTQLKKQSAKASQTSSDAAKIALYATQLEGEIKALKEQLGVAQGENNRLNQEISALQVTLATRPVPSTTPQVAVTKPQPQIIVAKPLIPTPTIAQSNSKIVGKLLSVRRNTTKKTDELVIGVSLTNTSNQVINGILMGPEITAIDNANNMFALKDERGIQGITTCASYSKLYNTMSWCEERLKDDRLSTTSFRPGVPVNIVVTLPAINADPKAATTKVNASLFLLLEGKEGEEYENFPVDIIGAKAS